MQSHKKSPRSLLPLTLLALSFALMGAPCPLLDPGEEPECERDSDCDDDEECNIDGECESAEDNNNNNGGGTEAADAAAQAICDHFAECDADFGPTCASEKEDEHAAAAGVDDPACAAWIDARAALFACAATIPCEQLFDGTTTLCTAENDALNALEDEGAGLCGSGVAPAPPPAEWTCPADFWGDRICDCGCGVPDIDPCAPDECGPGEGEGEGEGEGDPPPPVPEGWTCPADFFADTICDCGCGALDVSDCEAGCAEPGCSAASCEACIAADGTDVACVPPP